MSIKAMVLTALRFAPAALTARQVQAEVEDATVGTVVQILSTLKAEGLVEPAGKSEPAEGERSMTLWRLTDQGGALAEKAQAQVDAGAPRGGVTRTRKAKRRAARRPKRTRRARKVQRRGAGSRRTSGVPRASRTRGTGKPRLGDQFGAAHRWALTGDRSLVLLGSEVEIVRPAARTLIAFLRGLDDAMFGEDA